MKKDPRSFAFQFEPAKALAGTVHLSAQAFRAYWLVLWWMWMHSKTGYAMIDTDNAWKKATLIRDARVLKQVRDEIMAPEFALLRLVGRNLISEGLKKEVMKQRKWREKSSKGGKASAKVRWGNELDESGNSNHTGKGGYKMVTSKSNILLPFLLPLKNLRNVLKGRDGAERTAMEEAIQRFLLNCAELMGEDKRCLISKEQIIQDRNTLVNLAVFVCKNYAHVEWNNQLDRAYNSLEEQIDNKNLRTPMAAFTSAARRMWSEWKYGRSGAKRK